MAWESGTGSCMKVEGPAAGLPEMRSRLVVECMASKARARWRYGVGSPAQAGAGSWGQPPMPAAGCPAVRARHRAIASSLSSNRAQVHGCAAVQLGMRHTSRPPRVTQQWLAWLPASVRHRIISFQRQGQRIPGHSCLPGAAAAAAGLASGAAPRQEEASSSGAFGRRCCSRPGGGRRRQDQLGLAAWCCQCVWLYL